MRVAVRVACLPAPASVIMARVVAGDGDMTLGPVETCGQGESSPRTHLAASPRPQAVSTATPRTTQGDTKVVPPVPKSDLGGGKALAPTRAPAPGSLLRKLEVTAHFFQVYAIIVMLSFHTVWPSLWARVKSVYDYPPFISTLQIGHLGLLTSQSAMGRASAVSKDAYPRDLYLQLQYWAGMCLRHQ